MAKKFYDIDLDGKSGAILGEWQLCPKCLGQGIVSRPPWIAADVQQWSGTEANYQCNVCNGAKIIARPMLNSEQSVQEWRRNDDDSSNADGKQTSFAT